MSKPQSIKLEPWTSFSKQSYSIFSDDFVHEKLLTVKVNQKPSRGAINLKQQLVKKGDALKSSGQIKLWFPIWNSRLGQIYFRSKNNQIKLHYDDGLKTLTGGKFSQYNLYGSFQSEKNFKNIVLKAGANLINANYNVDTRVRVGFTETGESDVSTGHKFNYSKNNWSFDSYDVFSFKTKAIINNAIRVGYRQGDNEFFLRAENETSRTFKNLDFTNLDTYFTRFTADAIRRVDDSTKAALEAEFTKKGLDKASLVVQKSIAKRDSTFKLRLSSDKSVAFSYQALIKDYGKWTAGWEVKDLGKTNKSRVGLQFDVNF